MQKDLPPLNDSCPMYQLFDLLGKKWMVFIIFVLSEGVGNFNAILKVMPKMNSKILSERLDLLLERGYIERRVTESKPLKINYTLTPLGLELAKYLKQIGLWVKGV